MKNLLKLLALLIFLGFTSLGSAAVIYVDIDATGANNGLSWTNAYTDLQDALAVAGLGDEIWVANGVYKPTNTTNRNISFVIPDGVSLFGGFAAGETTRAERDWNANATILSGAIGSQVDVTDNTETLISMFGASDDIVISGFKIQRAYGDFLSNVSIINCSQVRFRQCDFRINYSGGYNFYVQFSKVDFNDCLFRDNEGGSIISVANEGIVNDINSTWSDNIGFSIYFTTADESYVTMQNAVVSGNDLIGPVCSTGNFSQAENCVITEPTLGFTTTSNINTDDPLFVDPSTNNFRLSNNSPAIGFGNNSFTNQGYDLGHDLRIQGDNVDAGCYEANVPTTIYVDVDATGLNNGANWANAFNDLQVALAVAEAGDEVWVAEGTYYPTTTTQRSERFVLDNDVKLYGGFDATETNLNQRNWIENLTILSGDIGTTNVQTDNSYHVVMAANASGNNHIDGFVIEDGYANTGTLNGEGGGISVQATTNCEIRNCWLRNNFALRGGGIHVRLTNGAVTIGQTVFQFNEGNEGSALYFDDNVEVESCFFSGNTTNSKGTVYGVQNFDLEMTNCTLFNNTLPAGSRVIDGNGTNDVWDIVNCIIWANNMDAGLEPIRNVGPNTDVRLSIVQNGHTGGTQVFDQDPLFMNPMGGDFGLQPQSVGFNAGDDSVVEETLDAVRNDRIRAGQVDFGAVESSGTPASVIYVDMDASGANNGSSWADAYTSLYDAFAVAVDGDHIWVAEGTYLIPTVIETNEGIHFHGGFNGTETFLAQANWQLNETILSGDIGVAGLQSDNNSEILDINLDEDHVSISGFIFEDTYSDQIGTRTVQITSKNDYSGQSTVDLKNCIFRRLISTNSSYPAGIISNTTLSNSMLATVENCLFYDCLSTNAIFGTGNSQSVMSIIGCTFSNNMNTTSVGSVVSGILFINNSIFWWNFGGTASFFGKYDTNVQGSNNIFQVGSIVGSNNYVVNPQFTDLENNDYSLSPSSPAIGLGDNSLVTVDFDIQHNPRIQFANVDAGAIESAFETIEGCTDATACNYNSFAQVDDGSCGYPGCTDETACNFDPAAGCDDDSCTEPLWYIPNNIGIGPIVLACEQPAGYFLADQTCAQQIVDGDPYCVNNSWDSICASAYSCCIGFFGCADASACNYEQLACADNSLCEYPGCLIESACNYDASATCGYNDLCIFDCAPPVPGVIYVDEDASGNNDGSSWQHAFLTLYDALDAVVAGEEIWVAEGTYFASGTDNQSDELNIGNDIKVFGGFNATETDRTQRDWNLNPTIISGELGDEFDLTDNTAIMLRFTGTLSLSEFDGFILEDTHSDFAPNFLFNGAICQIRNCVFKNNYFASYLFSSVAAASIVFENCLIIDNFRTLAQGTIFSSGAGSQTQLINCTVANNEGNGLGYSAGTGAFIAIENCIVWGNTFTNLLSGSGLSARNSIISNISFSGVEENVIHENPEFIGGGNYMLLATSPAIGLGDNAQVFSNADLANAQRIQNNGVDAGAFESSFTLSGCLDIMACNYNPNADSDDGSCDYDCTPSCLGDFNYDGLINSADLLELLTGYTTNCGFPYCSGDMNGDSLVDTSDILDFLGVFGTPCN